jgi:polyisoprenoid-binding protein YceI
MKSTFFLSAITAMFVLASCGSNSSTEASGEAAEAGATAVNYTIDPASSKVEWVAKKVTGQHNGTVALKSGELKAEAGTITAGKFTLDMNSILVLDLPAEDEYNAKLLGHLKSADFFNVESAPESSFEIVSVEPIAGAAAGAANYNVKGNLTIKGISKAITFPATINVSENDVAANAEFDIDRTEWDIKYGSGKFFQDLGDKMINDAFTVKFALNAKKA